MPVNKARSKVSKKTAAGGPVGGTKARKAIVKGPAQQEALAKQSPLQPTTIDNLRSEANLVDLESQVPAPTVATGRPVRANRGGRIAQLQETSDLLGQGLAKKMTGAGSKRPRNQLDNAPDDLPESVMAPPVKAKRQRATNPVPAFRVPDYADGPLQMAPLPNLNLPINIQCQGPQNGSLGIVPITNLNTTSTTQTVFQINSHTAQLDPGHYDRGAQPSAADINSHSNINNYVPGSQLPPAIQSLPSPHLSPAVQPLSGPHMPLAIRTSSRSHLPPAAQSLPSAYSQSDPRPQTWETPVSHNEPFQSGKFPSRTSHDLNDFNDILSDDDTNEDEDEDMDQEKSDNVEPEDSSGEGDDAPVPSSFMNQSGLFFPRDMNIADSYDTHDSGDGFNSADDIYEDETPQEPVKPGSSRSEALGDRLIVVDEISPSEDEREADAVLHAPQTINPPRSLNAESTNVLEQHHKRNKPNRPPTTAHLAAAAVQQNGLTSQQPTNRQHDTDMEDGVANIEDYNADPSPEPENLYLRPPHHSKSKHQAAGPTTVQYYPGSWKEVLERAKNRFARHVFLNQAFPVHAQDIGIARDILHEEIAKGQAENLTLDHSYEHSRNMDIIVFDAGTTIRGRLKSMAREIVASAYSDILEAKDYDGGNQLGEQAIIKEQVEDSLKEGKILEGGIDDQGRTNNLAHPCISKLCITFFYSGDRCLARFFPDDFKDTIPEKAVALVMTCIHNCLDEYAVNGTSDVGLPFEGSKYGTLYQGMLDLIDEIKSNEYHGRKWQDNRIRWAKRGCQRLHPEKAVKKHHLRVKLD